MLRRMVSATFAFSMGLTVTVGTAWADRWDDYGPDRRREHWKHERWERRHAYERQYLQPGYYAPPPVYYAPPRAYYPPPPGVGLIVPFR